MSLCGRSGVRFSPAKFHLPHEAVDFGLVVAFIRFCDMGQGLLEEVDVVINSTGDRSLERCVVNFLDGTRFEESERRPVTDVRIPLRFTRDRDGFGGGQ